MRAITCTTGAVMMVPRAVMEEVGLLDADLFFYVEDVDWSLRILAAGYSIYFVPAGKVWHKVSADSGGEHSPTLAYYGMRNRLEVGRRHARSNSLAALRRHAVTVAAELAHARRSPHPLENIRSSLEGWRDYRRRRFGARGRAR